ncbi:MAG: SpoIIE family protein phosphatase [Clostridia bacterium]|nr:SpoIIE family protein phosphatase [Clostridia bacterium]
MAIHRAATIPLPRGREQEGQITLLWCVLGLLVPRATLYGELAPFGIGLAAAGGGSVPLLVSLLAGYLLAPIPSQTLRYMATVAMVGALRWVVSSLPELSRRPFVPPLLGFSATAVTGFVILSQSGADAYRVLLLIAESLVAGGSSLFFASTVRLRRQWGDNPTLSAGQQAAVILTGAVAVMAASTVAVGGFSPGRVAASFLILLVARAGRESGGCLAGVILGSGLALVSPGQTALAIALAFGGLMAGLFSRFGKLTQALLYLLAGGVVTLAEVNEGMLFYLYEIAVACVLFVVLPQQADRRLHQLLWRSRDLPAIEGVRRMTVLRLQVAAGALGEVSRAVTEVSRRLAHRGPMDLGGLFRGCAAGVCEGCSLRGVCWEQHRGDMLAALEAMTPLLRQEGELTVEQLTGFPAQRCRRPDRLIAYLNRGYGEMLAEESAWQRLQEIQQAVEGQFAGSEELLRSLAAQVADPAQVDTALSGQVLAVCQDYGMGVQEALCTRDSGGRLTIEILTADDPPTSGRWLSDLTRLCDRPFAPPVVVEWGEHLRVTLSEPPRYRVESGLAQRCCEQEKLCGDTAAVERLGGYTVAVLSDGMGSGGRAAVDSAMAVGVAARLWKAGYSPDGILQTVNAALQVKCREESLATLDVAAIDTHSGRLDVYKAGAAVSLLCSGGRVSRIDPTSLPIGILPQVRFEHTRDMLAAGDILLLLSDGALVDGVAPLEELLRAYPADGDMQTLAQAVVDAAYEAQTDHSDDITALALRLTRPTASPTE